jgi:hypothetical protein
LIFSCDSGQQEYFKGLSNSSISIQGINLYAEGEWADKVYQYFSLKGFPQYAIVDPGYRLLDNTVPAAPEVRSMLDSLLMK